MKSSGIGGQAVLEGVMMRHKQDVAVAVRTPDKKIEVGKSSFSSVTKQYKILGIPVIRGVVSFVESLIVGIKTLTFSASFYDTEEEVPPKKEAEVKTADAENTKNEAGIDADLGNGVESEKCGDSGNSVESEKCADLGNGVESEKCGDSGSVAETENGGKSENDAGKETGPKKEQTLNSGFTSPAEKAALIGTVVFSVCIAIALFVLVPYVVSHFILKNLTDSTVLLAIIEGAIKMVIFIGYLFAISRLEDIKRTFMYHGAEHKCINCIETGNDLVVENVMKASKEHRRCGTSFIFIVLFISIIFFIFIRVDNFWLRLLIRLLLVPVIAGVSFEIIQWTGRSECKFAYIISRPGMWFQGLTTKEPTPDMVEVAICSVEAVFDWKQYLTEEFGKEYPKTEEIMANNASDVNDVSCENDAEVTDTDGTTPETSVPEKINIENEAGNPDIKTTNTEPVSDEMVKPEV